MVAVEGIEGRKIHRRSSPGPRLGLSRDERMARNARANDNFYEKKET